jgi:hypothetical protein
MNLYIYYIEDSSAALPHAEDIKKLFCTIGCLLKMGQ